jgi:pantetheine-phosphate adenylyltransferase
MTDRIAVYPGSFDPLTNGHLDILAGRRLADRIIVALLDHDGEPALTVEAHRMIREIVGGLDLGRLLLGAPVGFAQLGATIIVRGLRAVSDYSTSCRWPDEPAAGAMVGAVFLMAKEGVSHVSADWSRSWRAWEAT